MPRRAVRRASRACTARVSNRCGTSPACVTFCSTPPCSSATTSRVGRSAVSSTSTAGFANPAEVHRSPASAGWPQAHAGRWDRARSAGHADEHRDDERQRERQAQGGKAARAGQVERRAVREHDLAGRERREFGEQHTREHGECDARGGKEAERRARGERRLGGGLALGAPRRAEQHEADDLHEAPCGERRRRGEQRCGDRSRQRDAERPEHREVQQRLEREPLRGEARRAAAAPRSRARRRERPAGPWHPPQQAAEAVELERADRPREHAGAEEEQRLEDGMVQRVEQRGAERDGAQVG